MLNLLVDNYKRKVKNLCENENEDIKSFTLNVLSAKIVDFRKELERKRKELVKENKKNSRLREFNKMKEKD